MAINKMTKPTIHDILTKASQEKTRENKIKILKEYNTLALRDILKAGFDDTITFTLPKGTPPYQKSSEKNPPSTLRKHCNKFKYFVSTDTKVSKVKIESMFVNILESIHPDDAELLIKAKDKELEGVYKGITKKLVQDTFPGLISE